MQAALNSAVSLMIDHLFNKLAFNINLNMLIDLFNQELDKIQNFTVCINVEKAIKLSQMTMKCYYDNKHQSKFFIFTVYVFIIQLYICCSVIYLSMQSLFIFDIIFIIHYITFDISYSIAIINIYHCYS